MGFCKSMDDLGPYRLEDGKVVRGSALRTNPYYDTGLYVPPEVKARMQAQLTGEAALDRSPEARAARGIA